MSITITQKRDLSILLGNAFDHYDISIYSFLAPVMAPVFFPGYDPVVQLILTYGILATSIITQPLGAFLFGRLAARKGPNIGLSFSLAGVALSTMIMGCIPGFDRWGIAAPLALTFIRFIRGIFAAGETTVAKLYILEGKTESNALKASYLYQSSTMIGIVLASALSTVVIKYHPDAWRLCFIMGGITGIIAYALRQLVIKSEMTKEHTPLFKNFEKHSLKLLWRHRANIIRVALTDIFGHVTYVVPFIFMNSFIPLVTDIPLETMMEINTYLIFLDAALIPIVGPIVAQFNPRKVMLTASFVLSVTFIPLFHFLMEAPFFYVLFVRLWVLFWGIVFLCPLNVWCKNLFPTPEKYYLVGMGSALGSGTLGRTLTPIFIWLWHMSNVSAVPAIYMSILTIVTFIGIYTKKE